MPVSGEVIEVRQRPQAANSDPLNIGWFFKVKLSGQRRSSMPMDETSYTPSRKALTQGSCHADCHPPRRWAP
jgi:glycine cleavage system H protein